MKRAAAIVGPTPSFVRWAIRFDCPFRQNEFSNLPYQTFRQLRNLREVSIGRLEKRIIDGVCIHRDFDQDCETARGFCVEEVQSFFAETDDVQDSCGHCPANVVRHQSADIESRPTIDSSNLNAVQNSVWAGCYGWVPSSLNELDLISEFERIAKAESNDFERFRQTNRIWYSIWQTNRWTGNERSDLQRFLSKLPAARLVDSPDLADLVRAVDSCCKNELVLETELIPNGNSDGIEWRIESHCTNCRCEMSPNERKCGECQRIGHPIAAKIRRVLGLRPYMRLQEIFGRQETLRLLTAHHQNRSRQ